MAFDYDFSRKLSYRFVRGTLDNRSFSRWISRRPSTGPGERIYAIGDVHGRYDLLVDLLDRIAQDWKDRDEARTIVILLGDLIDRGPSSKDVIDFARRFDATNDRFLVLCGNHEEMLLESAAGNSTVQQLWLENGGLATLASYDIERPRVSKLSADKLAKLITKTLGEDTLGWMRELPLSFRSGDYFFCHAGVKPGVALDEQRREDLLWIRDEFLFDSENHGAVIVHGHSEGIAVERKSNRINIDTAAHRTGLLTCVGLEGSDCWFLTSSDED